MSQQDTSCYFEIMAGNVPAKLWGTAVVLIPSHSSPTASKDFHATRSTGRTKTQAGKLP